MKVAWISVMPPSQDGLAEYSLNLLGEMRKDKKIDLVVLAQKKPKTKLKGLKVVNCWEKNKKISEQIIKQLEKEKPDIVHVQFLAGMFGKKNLPYLTKLFKELEKYKTFATIHSDLGRIPLKKVFSKLFFSNIDKFFVLSKNQKELLGKGFGVKGSKIKKIPHGCYIRKPLTRKSKTKNLLCFGFIRESKGLKEIVRVFNEVNEKVPDSRLVIAGKCEDRNYLGAVKKGVKGNVKIVNKFLTNREITKQFSDADLVIDFPKDEGGPSGSINMAAAYGKGVVCADTQYLSEYVRGSKAGVLVKKGSYDSLKKKIVVLLKSKKKINALEKNARTYCKKNSFKEVSKLILKEYKR